MPPPNGFSWIEKPLLSALARPQSLEDLKWLRHSGIEVILSLTEDPPRRDWINDAGLLAVHVPFEDMQAPTAEQLDRAVHTITKAQAKNMPVAVHCGAGMGRTGVVLAAWFVTRGLTPDNAIARVRRLRPGSIETDDQERAVGDFARRHQSP